MTDARQVLSHGSCYLVEMSPPGTFQQYCREVRYRICGPTTTAEGPRRELFKSVAEALSRIQGGYTACAVEEVVIWVPQEPTQ
jgi:hypothetical protein